jgi:hypothetical protein
MHAHRFERGHDVRTDSRSRTSADGAQALRTRSARPFDRDVGRVSVRANDGLDTRIIDATQRNAAGFDEFERRADDIPRKPRSDRGRKPRSPRNKPGQ